MIDSRWKQSARARVRRNRSTKRAFALPPHHDDHHGCTPGRIALAWHRNRIRMRRPLGITIVGGLIMSQALTCSLTPVVYLYLDRFRLMLGSKRHIDPTSLAPSRRGPCELIDARSSNRSRCHPERRDDSLGSACGVEGRFCNHMLVRSRASSTRVCLHLGHRSPSKHKVHSTA